MHISDFTLMIHQILSFTFFNVLLIEPCSACESTPLTYLNITIFSCICTKHFYDRLELKRKE